MEQQVAPMPGVSVHLRHRDSNPQLRQDQMLDHLLDFDPEVLPKSQAPSPAEKVMPVELLNGKINTNDWLKEMGIPDAETAVSELEKQQARETFSALTTASPIKEQHDLVSKIETPAAVRHLVGMLTAYDWEFVHQAKELRGYAVAKLLEDCENPNANIRLKALGLLGKVTEVGLFTEKIEVKKTDMTEDEIDKRLKEKLAKFMNVADADVMDITEVAPNTAPTDDNQPTIDA
jgi:hypothetical protein